MVKLFTLTIILSGILIAHVICPRPPETKKPSRPETNQPAADVDDSEAEETEIETDDSDDDDDEDDVANQEEDSASEDEETEDEIDIDEEEAEPSLPFLTCSVFNDNFACNAMCSVLRSIYGTPITSGVCEEAKECECQVLPTATLADYWNEKFLAKNTLQEILQDKKLSEKILKVLKTPFKTVQQTIEALKPHLSPKQLSTLRIKNKSAQKIFSNDGEINKVAVQKYVASKLKSLGKPSEGFDYKKTLLDMLNSPDNKDIVDHIINEIRQSKNKLLNSVIEDYIKEHGIQVKEPAIDSNDQDTIIDFLDTAVINELIKPPTRQNALKLSGLRSHPKKPAVSQADSRWMLRGLNKTEVSRVKKGEKCWNNESYEVCTYKGSSLVQVSWNNLADDVHMEVFNNGDIKQYFYFKDYQPDVHCYDRVHVTIQKFSKTGSQMELWQFPYTKLRLTKGPDGKIKKEWSDIEDLQSLEKYKKYIEAWCAHNDYFVGKGNCVITLG